MPKALQYGPQPYVSESNPDWEERQCAPENLMNPPERGTPTPKAYPIDLYHLSQQPFAHDIGAMKRWFLTAFVAPEDRHLLAPPADSSSAIRVLQAVREALTKPASKNTPETREALRDQMMSLFKLDKWLGVALQMVDTKALSIDILNTLIHWQALYIQFGEQFFSLECVANTHANQTTVHHGMFAQAQLTLEELQNTAWGKIVSTKEAWEPTLENFSKAIIGHHKYVTINEKTICFQSPSTLLVEHELVTQPHPSHIIPLHTLGYLACEDFCAAAFLGGRPMQAYLPEAKGNLYWAHERYYGQALMVHHDYLHAATYAEAEKDTFVKELRMVAIIANAMARINLPEDANEIVDQGNLVKLWSKLVLHSKTRRTPEALAQRKTLLAAIYHEFSLAVGINLAFTCKKDAENKDVYHLKSMYQNQAITFTVNLSGQRGEIRFADCFQRDYDAILSLTTHTRSCLLHQHQIQTNGKSEPDINTVVSWRPSAHGAI